MVSIIIPIHDVEQYIERCLYSVIRQTHADIECVLIDDVCTDRSMSLCEKIISAYDGPIKFKTIHSQVKQGPSGGRNIGTGAASGEYIYYLDSDDEITDDCIEKLYKMTLMYPDAEIVYGGIFSERNAEYYDMSKYAGFCNVVDNTWFRKEFLKLKGGLPTVVWNKLIRKDFLQKHNISFEPGIIHEDELWMFQVVKCLQNACFISDITYRHYSVPGSIMTDLQISFSNKCWFIILGRIIELMDAPMLDLQIRRYLFELLQRESQFEDLGVRDLLIRYFMKVTSGKMFFALSSYLVLKGPSMRMYLNHYCHTGCTEGMLRQFISDLKYYAVNLFQ